MQIIFWGHLSQISLLGAAIGGVAGLFCWFQIWIHSGKKVSFFKRKELFQQVFARREETGPTQFSLMVFFGIFLMSILIPALDGEIELAPPLFWLIIFLWRWKRYMGFQPDKV